MPWKISVTVKFNFTLENLPPREKVTVSVSAHTEETFYFCTHFLMIYNANFRDLVLVCISHSRSNYQRWKLHVIHCYLIATFFLLNTQIQGFFSYCKTVFLSKWNVALFSKVYCLDVMQAFICPDECNMYWSVLFDFWFSAKQMKSLKKWITEDNQQLHDSVFVFSKFTTKISFKI